MAWPFIDWPDAVWRDSPPGWPPARRRSPEVSAGSGGGQLGDAPGARRPVRSALDGDAAGKGLHLVLPALLQRTLDIGYPDLVIGDLVQPLTLQDLVHDRADARPPGEFLVAGHAPGAVGMR